MSLARTEEIAPWAEALPGQRTDTRALYSLAGTPTGGWDVLLTNLTSTFHVVEKLILIPGGPGLIEFRDENEAILWLSPPSWRTLAGPRTIFQGRTHALRLVRDIRVANAAQEVRMWLGVRYEA